MAYHNPIYQTASSEANANVSTAGAIAVAAGPSGLAGRLVSISATLTANVTGAPSEILVGTEEEPSKYGTLTLPVAFTGFSFNDAVINNVEINEIPPDSAVLITTDGGSTAGTAAVSVIIAWY